MKEEVLIRKLIADGEGTGEEKKFSQLAGFFRDIKKTDEVKNGEVSKCLKALDSLDLSLMKQKQIAAMNTRQKDDFVALAGAVHSQINDTLRKMEEAKEQLVEARVVKRNRQEYSTVVKVVESDPSRAETSRRLEVVRDELESFNDVRRNLENRLNDRKNQFRAFNVLLFNFQQFIKEDVESGIEGEVDSDSEEKNDHVPESQPSTGVNSTEPVPMET